MALTVLTNLASVNVKRHLEESSEVYAQAAEKIASGKRINHAGDDAAGLSISFSLEAKARSLAQSKRNTLDALSLMQVAEGGMNDIGNMLVRLRELAIQGASDNVSDKEREMLQLEVVALKDEINRLSEATRYFDTPLLNGKGKSFVFQVGPDNSEFNRLEFDTSKLNLKGAALGVDGVDMSDIDSARDSFAAIDNAIIKMNVPRAAVGAMQSRLHAVASNLTSYEETTNAAKSRVLDADIAKETATLVQGQVLQKTGIALLAQANMQPALALKLLGE